MEAKFNSDYLYLIVLKGKHIVPPFTLPVGDDECSAECDYSKYWNDSKSALERYAFWVEHDEYLTLEQSFWISG